MVFLQADAFFMVTKAEFLVDSSHKIMFYLTPKHCFWLNQIDFWFGILNEKIVETGKTHESI
jgi:hypothetical protein